MTDRDEFKKLKQQEESAKAELIRRINEIRMRLKTSDTNALDVFIQGVLKGNKNER